MMRIPVASYYASVNPSLVLTPESGVATQERPRLAPTTCVPVQPMCTHATCAPGVSNAATMNAKVHERSSLDAAHLKAQVRVLEQEVKILRSGLAQTQKPKGSIHPPSRCTSNTPGRAHHSTSTGKPEIAFGRRVNFSKRRPASTSPRGGTTTRPSVGNESPRSDSKSVQGTLSPRQQEPTTRNTWLETAALFPSPGGLTAVNAFLKSSIPGVVTNTLPASTIDALTSNIEIQPQMATGHYRTEPTIWGSADPARLYSRSSIGNTALGSVGEVVPPLSVTGGPGLTPPVSKPPEWALPVPPAPSTEVTTTDHTADISSAATIPVDELTTVIRALSDANQTLRKELADTQNALHERDQLIEKLMPVCGGSHRQEGPRFLPSGGLYPTLHGSVTYTVPPVARLDLAKSGLADLSHLTATDPMRGVTTPAVPPSAVPLPVPSTPTISSAPSTGTIPSAPPPPPLTTPPPAVDTDALRAIAATSNQEKDAALKALEVEKEKVAAWERWYMKHKRAITSVVGTGQPVGCERPSEWDSPGVWSNHARPYASRYTVEPACRAPRCEHPVNERNFAADTGAKTRRADIERRLEEDEKRSLASKVHHTQAPAAGRSGGGTHLTSETQMMLASGSGEWHRLDRATVALLAKESALREIAEQEREVAEKCLQDARREEEDTIDDGRPVSPPLESKAEVIKKAP